MILLFLAPEIQGEFLFLSHVTTRRNIVAERNPRGAEDSYPFSPIKTGSTRPDAKSALYGPVFITRGDRVADRVFQDAIGRVRPTQAPAGECHPCHRARRKTTLSRSSCTVTNSPRGALAVEALRPGAASQALSHAFGPDVSRYSTWYSHTSPFDE